MKTIFNRVRRNTLRVWIVLFFVLMILPGGVLLIIGNRNYQAGVRLYTQDNTQRLVDNESRQEGQYIKVAKQILISLAQMPLTQNPGDPLCKKVIASVKNQYAYFSNLVIANVNGDVICSSPQIEAPINLSDRAYFQQALATQDYAISDYQVSRLSDTPAIVVAYPVLDTQRRAQFVVLAAMDLGWMGKDLAEVRLPAGAAVTILDRNGKPVAFTADGPQKMDFFFNDPASQAWFIGHQTGVQEMKSAGVNRWLGYAPVPDTHNALTVALSLPQDYIGPELNQISSANLVWFGGAALLMLILSGLWIEYFVLRRIKKLQTAIQSFQSGDWNARSGIKGSFGEVNELAADFDKMADAMQAQASQVIQSRDFYFGLFEFFPTMVWCADVDGKSVYYNRAWAEYTGKTLADLQHEAWSNLIYPEDLERTVAASDKARLEKSPITMEYRMRRKDGEYHWVLDIGTPFYDPKGVFSGFIGGIMDISERKANESLLERYQILSDHSRDMMFFLKRDGTILEANSTAVQTYGYAREELLKMNMRQLRTPSRMADIDDELEKADRSGYVFETEHIRKDGSTFPAEVSSVGSDVGGERVLFSVVRDITERNNMQAAVFASKKMADLGTLASGVAVKLRDPLNKIIHLSEDLADKSGAPAYDAHDGLDDLLQIQRAGWECAEVLSALETYTRATPEEMQPCDLNDIVKEVMILLEPQIRNWSRINLVTDFDLNLPKLLCDQDQIMQVLIVLLNNARDAMPDGGTLAIQTLHDDKAQTLSLQVSDTGIGIQPESFDRIFDPFFTTKPAGKGTGLGLSIASGITRAHLGTISVVSAPRHGSTFTLIFPAFIGNLAAENKLSVEAV
jgi:PAS domain S-box-containing protein